MGSGRTIAGKQVGWAPWTYASGGGGQRMRRDAARATCKEDQPMMKHRYWSILLLAGTAGLLSSCQAYDKYSVEVRDPETLQPMSRARVEVSYSFTETLRRIFSWEPELKRSKVTTDALGCATVNVARDEQWFLHVTPYDPSSWRDGFYVGSASSVRNRFSAHFDPPMVLNQSLAPVDERDGWLLAPRTPLREPGVVAVRVAPNKK
jgi:hypothetical protein